MSTQQTKTLTRIWSAMVGKRASWDLQRRGRPLMLPLGSGRFSPIERVHAGAGLLAIVAGLIHLIVAPEHFTEAFEVGGFVLLVGVAQVVAGVLFFLRPGQRLVRATMFLTLLVFFAYAISHTVGLPFGHHHHGEPAEIHAIDVVSKAMELGLLWTLLSLIRLPVPVVRFNLTKHGGGRIQRAMIILTSFVLLAGLVLPGVNGTASASSSDIMQLTDEPGNWFKSEATGTPVTFIDVGDRVDFKAGELTNTRHTATLVSRPPGSSLVVDQEAAWRGGGASARFDKPGVYLFLCKVHPYMNGVAAVRDASGNVPPVTKEQLPFVGHLGVDSLPASTVLSVMPTIAATEADKLAKWDILGAADHVQPQVPGVGEVWVNTQFEAVPGQTDDAGVPKPGTVTVVDAASFTVEREINGLDPDARGRWNNPHNLWSDVRSSTVYNTNWFGEWVNKIDRASGDVLASAKVGDAPTHIVTNPNEHSTHAKGMTLPLSADNDLLNLDKRDLTIMSSTTTGSGKTHPHGQWITADGSKVVVPNMFKGLGVAGSISIMDLETSEVLKELTGPTIGLPVAVGIKGSSKAYVANIVSGQVSVVDLNTMQVTKNIPVTFTPDGKQGPEFDVFHTLQVPIQTPVSPDGRFVAVAVLSLTTVSRAPAGSADHVAIIDTATDTVVSYVGTARPGHSAGTHGANWGPKLGGGYYAYATNQHANALTVVDPDPNGDHSGVDATAAGRILLSNGSAGATDGTGGQGVGPLPNTYDGWVQDTVALSGTGELSPEVQGWIDALTPCQRNPSGPGC